MVCCCSASFSNAQTVDSTGNLIDNGSWTGAIPGSDPNDCCSNPAGSQPLYDTSTNTIKFSYGQATVGQIIGINNALSGVGSGIQVHGYNWGYDLRNNNSGHPTQSGVDTLTAGTWMTDSQGNTILSNTIIHNTKIDWTRFSGTQTLTNPYNLQDTGIVGIQFSGKDSGYWSGLYGPEIRNISLSLNYTAGAVDPCDTDPLYSTTCPGYAEAYKEMQCKANPLYDVSCPGYAEAFHAQQCAMNPLYATDCPGYSSVVTSSNLVPKPGSWYREVNQSFAINSAMSHNGSGVLIHGFRWGFQSFGLNIMGIGGSYRSDVNITDSQGGSLYSFSTGWRDAGTGYADRSYQYIFPESKNNLSLGTFNYTAQVDGLAAVGNFWARALYTPDNCSLDPLSSPLCSKYQEAFLDQQCAIYTLYSPSCPGYAEALQEMLAQSMAYGVTDSTVATGAVTGVDTGSNTSNTAGTQTATADPVPTAEVTTDIGGAELSTTGEVVVSTGAPEVKETVKEKAAEEKQTAEATASASTAEKKTTKVNALAIAQNAAREAEATALSVTDAAVAASLSENANPNDGIGLESAGIGLTLTGSRTPFGLGTNEMQVAIVSIDIMSQAARSRQESVETESAESSTAEAGQSETTVVDLVAPVVEAKAEEKPQTGPSVRRGGSVEGMEGGADINALATPPADFNSYLALQLQDRQFYAAKEIYKNQKNVDNARAFRGLGSDRLHQQMVDQQYNRINN